MHKISIASEGLGILVIYSYIFGGILLSTWSPAGRTTWEDYKTLGTSGLTAWGRPLEVSLWKVLHVNKGGAQPDMSSH